jgi:di/tricarboxylate transporter
MAYNCIVYIGSLISLFIGIFVRRCSHLFLNNYPALHDFPRKARKLAHGFSILACLTLIVTVLLQSNINAHYDEVDPYLSQVVNISITGFICLALIWSLSVLIDRSEESLMAEQKKSDDLLHNILPVNNSEGSKRKW